MAPSSPALSDSRHADSSLGWGSAMATAFLAMLARPSTWVVALAGFLVRGGLLLVLVPVVVIPTTSGFANAIGPTLIPFVFGQPSPALFTLISVTSMSVLVWLVASGLFGAWVDAALIREAAEDEELEMAAPPRPGVTWRGAVARFVAHVPFALALSWGAVTIVEAGYRELILPEDMATPLVLRVMIVVPHAVLVVVLTWMAGEALGGLAQRRLVLAPVSIGRALVQATAYLLRHPLTALGTMALTNGIVLAAAVAPALAAAVAWDRLGVALAVGDRLGVVVGLVGFVAIWLVGLLLLAVATAWRTFAWTFELCRRLRPAATAGRDARAAATRTIGPGESTRPGEWSTSDPSGSL